MAEQSVQNYANHPVNPKSIIIACVLMLVGSIAAIVSLFGQQTWGPSVLAAGVVLVGVGGILVAVNARTYATKLQDRIIRTEMRLRLTDILPTDLHAEIPKLNKAQLIGLRFASDAEMEDLVRKVLAEDIQKARPIKKLVKDWQADHHRV